MAHTEFGTVENGKVIFDRVSESGAKEGIQHACEISEKFGARVCFAAMPEVLASAKLELLDAKKAGHEIGMHLHADDAILVERGITSGKERGLALLSPDVQKKSISFGAKIFNRELGFLPKIFVSGKWSENDATRDALNEHGFTHDCSPFPGMRGLFCDWRNLGRFAAPYRYGRMVMVPVSETITGSVVSPETHGGLGVLNAAFEEYAIQNFPLFHIALHTPSMTDPRMRETFSQLLSFAYCAGADFSIPSEIHPSRAKGKSNIIPYIKYAKGAFINKVLGI